MVRGATHLFLWRIHFGLWVLFVEQSQAAGRKKGDLLSLQGEVLKPMIYGLIIGIFLIFRIPPIRKALASFSTRSLALLNKKDPQPKVDTP